MSFRQCIAAVILAAVTSTASFAFDFNSTSNNVTSDFNADNSTSGASTYPFWYMYGDESNTFCNIVAALNYFSPVVSLFAWKGTSYFVNRWDGQINHSIKESLDELADAENQIKRFLSGVIKDFQNGIDSNLDYSIALGLVENLNRNKCEECIKNFVTIVSKNCSNSSDTDHYSSAQSDQELIKANKKEFRTCARKMTKTIELKKCVGHAYKELERPVCEKKTLGNKVKSAVCGNWRHPFHWNNLGYALTMLGLPVWLSEYLKPNMQAGSRFGDWANWSNIFVIPSTQLWALFQSYWNHDRIKAQKLLEETEKRLSSIEGMFEIAARVIGQMENGITVPEARGFLKVLVLIGWPDEQVESFRKLATRQTTNFAIDMQAFLTSLKRQYKSKKITYDDSDIKSVFDLDQKTELIALEENDEFTIEMNQN